MFASHHLPTPPPPKAAGPPKGAILLLALLVALGSLRPAAAANEADVPRRPAALLRAVICENIQNFAPVNPAVVFPITIGKIFCFNIFDPVVQKTFIYHDWYCRDKLSKRVKLDLQPPRWSTYSSIQLREEDKGPWHVIITDPDGNIFHILRFSITD
ncbi:MAG: DUF2914 domain-containing protein [Desulfobacterales bacterium]